MNTKTETHEQERAFVINRLSEEMIYLEKQLDEIKGEGESKEYRALLKTYTDTACRSPFWSGRSTCGCCERFGQTQADALTEFNAPSPYDEDGRGLLVI